MHTKRTHNIKVKLRKGDEVVVIAGRDVGKRGSILRICKFSNNRVKAIVDDINKVSKCIKPNPEIGEKGGIKEQESFIDISNISILNPATNKPDKISYRFLEDGKKVRCYRSTGEVIDVDKG